MTKYAVQTLKITTNPSTSRVSKYPFRDMDVGDMFFAPGKKLAFYSQVSRVGGLLKRKFTCRALSLVRDPETAAWRHPEAGETGEAGMGVWRLA